MRSSSPPTTARQARSTRLGRNAGLPIAVSGQNNEWFWGPGTPSATTVVAVAPGPVDVTGYGTHLSQFFQHVRVVATLSNTAGLHNQEWVDTSTSAPDPTAMGTMWPRLPLRLKHLKSR